MRGATECARRVKAVLHALRSKLGKVSPPTGGDPITQMVLGILSRDAPESKAREALDRLRAMVVDYNELRVIPPIELAEMLGDYPEVRLKCEDISRSLNKVFSLHHNVGMSHLAGQSARDVRAYLDRIDGLEPYTRARIRLLGLQQHAIPLDEAMWAYARQEQMVDKHCGLEEAQAFLERQIAPEDALEFVALLRRQAWSDLGAAVRRGEVAHIRSVPPDRTTRNMLQLVGTSGVGALDLQPEDGDIEVQAGAVLAVPEHAPPAKSGPRTASKAAPARSATRAGSPPPGKSATAPSDRKVRPKRSARPGASKPKARAKSA